MRLRYIGPSFDDIENGKVYECLGVEDAGDFGEMLRIVDDDLDDWNYDDNPNWKPGYLYSPTRPAPLTGGQPAGRWEVVEDDEKGTLAAITSRD